jgi:hypothetical protein
MTLHGFTLTRLATACAAAAALLAAPALTAPPAQAASLSVVLSCEALGASQFACEADPSGGVPPYTDQWNGANSHGGGFCTPGTWQTVSVTVTDSVHASASASKTFLCLGGNPH